MSALNCASTSSSNATSNGSFQSGTGLLHSDDRIIHPSVAVVPLVNAGNNKQTAISTSMQSDSLEEIESKRIVKVPETINTDNIACDVDTGSVSQTFDSTQVTTQNVMAQMDKRFSFYKCDKLTININQKNL